ncbi:MAG: hypothetical protein IJS06_00645 [Prevotella sp.]|nr:hypothetical protein [Prevotella sp.]
MDKKTTDSVQAKDIMGFPGILSRYKKVILSDLIWPSLFTAALLGIAYRKDVYSPVVLKEAISVGLVVIPVLLSVLVAGYVLLLTIYFSGNIDCFKDKDEGRELLYSISANYAFCIVSSIGALVVTVVISFFFHLDLQSEFHVWVNYLSAAGIYLLLFFVLKNLKDLVIALFDFGQSFIYEQQLEKGRTPQSNEADKKEIESAWGT